MEFISENYLWIIIVVVVILMAIVGYIADKTGFIRKSEKVKKPKKEEVKEKKEESLIIDAKGINELANNTVTQDEPVVLDDAIKNNDLASDFNVNSYDNIASNDLNNEASIENGLEVNDPNEDTQNTYDNQEIDSSLFAPLGDASVQEDNYQNVEELPQENDYQNVEELPQIDVTSLENSESQDSSIVNEEEDLWKF